LKFSTRLFFISYLPNIAASIIYLYLATTYDANFPVTYVVISMLLTFTLASSIIKKFANPIDNALEEYKDSGLASEKCIQDVKKAHYLLSSRIPMVMVILITVSFYIISILVGNHPLFIFRMGKFLEFGHIIAIFSSSFIVQGFIYDNQIGLIRKRLNITSISEEKIIPIQFRVIILSFSMVLAFGFIILTYFTDFTLFTVWDKQNTVTLAQYSEQNSNKKNLEILEKVINNEKVVFKNAYQDILKLEERLKFLEKQPNEQKIKDLRNDLPPFKRDSQFFQNLKTQIDSVLRFFLSFLFVIILINYFIIKIFARGITNQMSVININIEKMLMRGKVVFEPLPIISMTEVSFLTNNFNRLLKKMNDQNIELEGFYHSLEDKVLEKTEELSKSEFKYRSLIENAPEAVMVIKDDYILFANPVAVRVMGYSKKELYETPFLNFIAPSSLDATAHRYEQRKITPDDHSFFETQIITKSKAKRWLRTIADTVEWDGDTALLYFLRDITERKQSEEALQKAHKELEKKVEKRTEDLQQSLENLKQMQNELIRSEKMAGLGQVVAGVSHEMATPLGIVKTEASYLDEISNSILKDFVNNSLTESRFKDFINTAVGASSSICRNVENMINQLHSFKNVSVDQSSDRLRVFKVKDYLGEILLNLHSKLKRTKHKIIIECPDELVLDSYPGVFSQIITNFMMNTLDHGFEGIEEGEIVFDIQEENSRLVFKYKDNGIGMDEKTVNQIFDPFFTTKRNRGGSGLGMNIVYNLVTQKLKGQIKCYSSLGKGTEFIIDIPLKLSKA